MSLIRRGQTAPFRRRSLRGPESCCSTDPPCQPSPRSPRELSLLQGWCLFSPRGVVLFVPFCFFLAGKAVRPAPSERYPPELIDVMALFPGIPPCCCCCCGCRSSPCALPVPPGTLTRRFEYTWTDTSTSRLAANCPQNGCRSFLSSNVGPGCSSRFYARARVGVSAPLLCRGRETTT